jgi:hypothetical protein
MYASLMVGDDPALRHEKKALCLPVVAGWRLDSPRDERILVQHQVGAPLVIVDQVESKVAKQRALVPHDDVIEALVPEGADHTFNKRMLPWRMRRRHHCLDAHLPRSTPRIRPVDPITIPDDESWRGVPRPRLAQRLCGPRRGRMRCDVYMDDRGVGRERAPRTQITRGRCQ